MPQFLGNTNELKGKQPRAEAQPERRGKAPKAKAPAAENVRWLVSR